MRHWGRSPGRDRAARRPARPPAWRSRDRRQRRQSAAQLDSHSPGSPRRPPSRSPTSNRSPSMKRRHVPAGRQPVERRPAQSSAARSRLESRRALLEPDAIEHVGGSLDRLDVLRASRRRRAPCMTASSARQPLSAYWPAIVCDRAGLPAFARSRCASATRCSSAYASGALPMQPQTQPRRSTVLALELARAVARASSG